MTKPILEALFCKTICKETSFMNENVCLSFQCKEQSKAALEAACLTVENAGKGGGVYPEVLFTVARHWYELYLVSLKFICRKFQFVTLSFHH